MSPTLIEARPRRFRVKIWMALLVPIVAAVPILSGAGIDPFRRDPAIVAIEAERTWAGEGSDAYRLFRGEDRSEETGRANCVVRIAYRDPGPVGLPYPNDNHQSFYRRAWITQNGCSQSLTLSAFSGGGGCSELDPASLTRARTLVAALPPGREPIEPFRSLVVGSLQKGAWDVRIYDRDDLPVEVEELIRLSGI